MTPIERYLLACLLADRLRKGEALDPVILDLRDRLLDEIGKEVGWSDIGRSNDVRNEALAREIGEMDEDEFAAGTDDQP